MAKIKCIGFDLDHTLAIYGDDFEALAFRETLKKFIEAGYPEELRLLNYKPDFIIRGLLVDIKRGNILKVDQHKYVKTAYHGKRKLSKSERDQLYNTSSYRAADLRTVDTFFALSEVQLFMEIVDFMSRNPGKIKQDFSQIYYDLKKFIDQSHADGSIKNEVVSNPGKFVQKNRNLGPFLEKLLASNKKLFLLTNSLWEYSDAILNYLLGTNQNKWQDYFDFSVVGANKPGFFNGSQPFYRVHTDSGLLSLHRGPLSHEHVYHAGNAKLLEKLTGFSGDKILYVGDHIYGDIMGSKDSLNWRTMLILTELTNEIKTLTKTKSKMKKIERLIHLQEKIDEEIQALIEQNSVHKSDSEYSKILLQKTNKSKKIKSDLKRMIEEREKMFHPKWGELMKVGLERSRFADQLSGYACIYSGDVTNLRFYSPFKLFSPNFEKLPHDQ